MSRGRERDLTDVHDVSILLQTNGDQLTLYKMKMKKKKKKKKKGKKLRCFSDYIKKPTRG